MSFLHSVSQSVRRTHQTHMRYYTAIDLCMYMTEIGGASEWMHLPVHPAADAAALHQTYHLKQTNTQTGREGLPCLSVGIHALLFSLTSIMNRMSATCV